MKQNKVKKMIGTMAMIVAATELLAGCGNSEERSAEMAAQSQAVEDSASENSSADSEGMETETAALSMELEVRFGDSGEPFEMHMENNETAQAIVRYVGTSDWRLPIYDRDDDVDYSVMEYYDIPSRYEIPASPKTVTEAKAGDVFYSDPNRIVLFYHDAEISEEYVKIGTFDATDEFISAVENNPVLEGWGNKIIQIAQP
ncbi:cyclophilin-like fold protein [Blautia sp. JLR.GB0024]|uniref:cyclophilin-like fold protein n=1 Tax=Blautia sp. JLR.GB0024 TaxID=3123295 RepID=UPI0030051175